MLSLALLLVVVLADLFFSAKRAALPEVTTPAIARFTKDRPGAVSLVFQNATGNARRLRFALGLPAVFASERDEAWIDLPAGAKHARVDWMCTPRGRGRFTGVIACAEVGSRLGFWRLRARTPLTCELRVYPNLFSERKQLAALFLSRGEFGSKLQRTVGRGRDFEKLRDYLPGDGFDEIHWKATAKRGRPITKVFQAERTQEIYVVIDASRLSGRPVTHEGVTQTVLERYLTAAMVLLLAADRQGDRFGLVVYDDRVRVSVRAGSGDGHYAACRDAILSMQPSATTPDMAEIVRHVRAQIRRRSLLFFLTDLSDPVLAEDFVKNAGLLARQHLVFINQLRAPGVAPLFSTGEIADADEIPAKLAGHARWAEAQALAKKLKPLGVTATLLEDETMAARVVSQYVQVKQRQTL
jgi:Uncharacterized conserved protein (some members contain a von Willebrand factor type A (vWA) domain)